MKKINYASVVDRIASQKTVEPEKFEDATSVLTILTGKGKEGAEWMGLTMNRRLLGCKKEQAGMVWLGEDNKDVFKQLIQAGVKVVPVGK